MNIKYKIFAFVIIAGLTLAACNEASMLKSADKGTETLLIYTDGRMVLNNRIMPNEDVIIYQDGLGGEKAAVKMYVPYHPPFYRDSIVVERLGSIN